MFKRLHNGCNNLYKPQNYSVLNTYFSSATFKNRSEKTSKNKVILEVIVLLQVKTGLMIC
ncbi:hypothetical protein DYU05_04895 [Mucilaginibacter terrenus]|uniref:Uncharacterized protein n=1 Tax=Mucilaginibacter terrenus TaxID=2482727 RepID=A0A3E2NV97_9SPHI|nr:hypothetical protein DYU05_04895 [Mucilaginibacter terrenus]